MSVALPSPIKCAVPRHYLMWRDSASPSRRLLQHLQESAEMCGLEIRSHQQTPVSA